MNLIKRVDISVREFNKSNLYIINLDQKTCESASRYIVEATCLNAVGQKTIYNVSGILPHFDIEYNEHVAKEIAKYEKVISDHSIMVERNGVISLNTVFLKPFNYYSEKLVPHIRLNCKTINNYSMLMQLLSGNEVIREHLRNNEMPNRYYLKAIQYNKMVNVENPPKEMVVMTWDIETYSSNKSRIPNGSSKDDSCFLICGTVHNFNSNEILKSYAISTVDIEEHIICKRVEYMRTLKKVSSLFRIIGSKIYNKLLEYLGVIKYDNLNIKVCTSEKDLIKEFIDTIHRIQPDIITGFNDHAYDWVFLKNKIQLQYPDLNGYMYNKLNIGKQYQSYHKCFTEETNKISADVGQVNIIYPVSNYIIFVDTRTEYMKLYPTDKKSSLKHFLEKMNIQSKEDMPYTTLFNIYETRNKIGMASATSYCITDAFRCQELLVKKNIVNEYNNMAYMTGMTLNLAIRRAISIKVFNYLLKEGIESDYAFIYRNAYGGHVESEGNSFQGGYVADPIYGLNLDCPVIGLDFASLYPNIQRTLNLGPDTLVRDIDVATYKKRGIPIRKINDRYVVDHNEKPELKSLMVRILTKLFDDRTVIKQKMLVLKRDKEKYGDSTNYKYILLSTLSRKGIKARNIFKKIYEYIGIDVLNVVITDLDQKQKAVKVLMNSFYGTLGSPINNLHCKFIAETITVTGRNMLKLVMEYITENGYTVHYGDTDSVYVSCKKECFHEAVRLFKNNQMTDRELFAEKINITKGKINILKDKINSHLVDKYVYSYMKMAYEEVLYPSFFISKKVYMGIEHMETINYDNVDDYMFVKGYSLVKRTSTMLTKHVIKNELLKKLFSMGTFSKHHMTGGTNVFDTIKDIVIHVIDKFNNNEYPISYFIKNDKYAPNKKNIRVLRFVERMKERVEAMTDDNLKRRYAPPEPNCRFDYIYVTRDANVAYNGKIVKVKGLGDVMEYPHYIQDYNSKIDYKRYFKSDLANELGSLIHPKQGKNQIIKLFESLIDNMHDKGSFKIIKEMQFDALLTYKNEIKQTKQKQLRCDAKSKTTEYGDFLKHVLVGYPLLYRYDLITTPYIFIYNINNDVAKLNFDTTNKKKSIIYSKFYGTSFYTPSSKGLFKRLNENVDILCGNFDTYIKQYLGTVHDRLNELIQGHCESIEVIVDFDTEKSLGDISSFILDNKKLLDALEDMSYRYYNGVYKLKKRESYNKYIDKLLATKDYKD